MKKFGSVLIVLFFLATSLFAQKGKMQAGGQVGLSIPVGTLSDFANIGFALQGNFLYGIHPDIDLTGSLGYVSWGTDADNVSAHSVPLTFGARYYFQRGNFSPYGLAELGLHFGGVSVDIPSFSVGGISYGGGSTGGSSTDFGLGLGGGFLYDLGNFKLDVTAKFNIISDTNNLLIMAGVLFPIQ